MSNKSALSIISALCFLGSTEGLFWTNKIGFWYWLIRATVCYAIIFVSLTRGQKQSKVQP